MFPKNDLMDSIVIDDVNEDKSIRAEQQTEKGTLLMISKGQWRGFLFLIFFALNIRVQWSLHTEDLLPYRGSIAI
ncbi:hypothetical protein UQ64_15200 [Paenibacillus etheri]|uniref:Uncharacterized protein n=1 Tax=Paenibacillus etheri TaxID=1306852 RepID=A0A0W1AZP0_9BACL|nr:hypothetical protein UQ64_15200 [Paenibacillus etheri]